METSLTLNELNLSSNFVLDAIRSNEGKCPFCGDLLTDGFWVSSGGESFACRACGRRGTAKTFMLMLGY